MHQLDALYKSHGSRCHIMIIWGHRDQIMTVIRQLRYIKSSMASIVAGWKSTLNQERTV